MTLPAPTPTPTPSEIPKPEKAPKVQHITNLHEIHVEGATIGQFLGKGDARNFTVYVVTSDPTHPFPPTLHKRAEEVIHVLSGRGRAIIDGATFEIGPGSLIYIPAGAIHHLEALDGPLTALTILSPPVSQGDDLYFVR